MTYAPPLRLIDGKIVTDKPASGYILDYTDLVNALPAQNGENYITNSDWRLRDTYVAPEKKRTAQEERNKIAYPAVLGQFNAPPNLPEIVDKGTDVKCAGDLSVYVPERYAMAVPIVDAAVKDVLSLCGEEGLKSAKMTLVVTHTDVPSGRTQRESFSHWHDHYSNIHDRADLIYGFATSLPTEFEVQNGIAAPPENSLFRFGGEVRHRSQKNEGEATRRLWGALIVDRERTRRDTVYNEAFVRQDDPLYQTFCTAARDVLSRAPLRLYDRPIPLGFPDLT